jgi:hypothetical protein
VRTPLFSRTLPTRSPQRPSSQPELRIGLIAEHTALQGERQRIVTEAAKDRVAGTAKKPSR